MFVKICGITNHEDAQAAIESGAQALGFIFHPPSPRYVVPGAISAWIHALPRHVWRVGVFVDREPAEVEAVCRELALDVAQLHGSEISSQYPRGTRVWKAFRISEAMPPAVSHCSAEAVLLDGMRSGATFNWALAKGMRNRVILAGGLDEHNVLDAIEAAHPWGVDVCSSLEKSPGTKDHARITRFLKASQPAWSTQT